ncbi:MAG TPA: MFS transporter [Aggregatilineales bacterium]|nr:MFS transporter [Aggregatilineales bacterium]
MTTVAAAQRANPAPLYLVIIAYLGFIIIGMPIGLRGVAWESGARADFAQPVGALGALILANTISYFLSSALASRLIQRFGLGNAMLGSFIVTGLALLGYALSPAWALMIVLGVVVGFGLGFVDAAMNVYFAAHHGPRLMNWLHACFGIGSAVAPLLLNFILAQGGTWRTTYTVIAALYAVLLLLIIVTRNQWTVNPAGEGDGVKPASGRATLALVIVWIGIVTFFVYGGVEIVPSDWGARLFTAARGIDQTEANNRISLYWFFFTIGRIAFGFIVPYFKAATLMRLCMIGTIIGAALLAVPPSDPTNTLGVIGLVIGAFSMSPLFALLVTATQEKLGPAHAPNAISFQVAAASAGIGILPALTGLIAEQTPSAVPIVWIVLGVILLGLFEVSQRVNVKG